MCVYSHFTYMVQLCTHFSRHKFFNSFYPCTHVHHLYNPYFISIIIIIIKKGIGPTPETRQSHTIRHRVSKIIPERYWEGNKSPATLWGYAARRRISIPMCDQSTTCNSALAHTAQVQHHNVGASCPACILLPQIYDVQSHNQARHQFKNRHHWLYGPVV